MIIADSLISILTATTSVLVVAGTSPSTPATGCTGYTCGGNTGFALGAAISDIDPVNHYVGAGGWRFLDFIDASGTPRPVRVWDSELVVPCSDQVTKCQSGGDLIGAKLVLDNADPSKGVIAITIQDVSRVQMFPLDIPPPYNYAYSYNLLVESHGAAPIHLCPSDFWWSDSNMAQHDYANAYPGENVPGVDFQQTFENSQWNVQTTEAVLFTGGVYRSTFPHVFTNASVGASPETFTIGCAGSAVAKTFLSGHALGNQLFVPSWGNNTGITLAESEAIMRMWLSEYDSSVCNPASPCTESGTPLHFQNHMGWFPTPTHTQLESKWGAGGSFCLDRTRHPWGTTNMAASPLLLCYWSTDPWLFATFIP